MLDVFAGTSGIPRKVLNALKRPTSLLIKTLKTMVDLAMPTYTGQDSLKKEENRELRNLVANHCVKSLDKTEVQDQKFTFSQSSLIFL